MPRKAKSAGSAHDHPGKCDAALFTLVGRPRSEGMATTPRPRDPNQPEESGHKLATCNRYASESATDDELSCVIWRKDDVYRHESFSREERCRGSFRESVAEP